MSKFKKGDKVRIVRKIEGDYGDDNCLYWDVDYMDPCVNDGNIYTVRDPDWYGGVELEEHPASWPEEALELVKE